MAHSGNNTSRPMSIDAMLDMERREVLALLENQNSSSSTERVRSASPYAAPRSPVRSLVDIAEEPAMTTRTAPGTQAPVRSMLDIDSPPSSPPPVPRSMLDVGVPSGSRTQPNSPTLPKASLATSSSTVSRSKSDAGFKPVDFGPRTRGGSRGGIGGGDPTAGYQFNNFYPANSAQQMPKRTSQSSKRPNVSAMAESLRNSDLSGLHFPGEVGRHASIGSNSSSSRFGTKSRSPHNRLSNRSRSPATFSSQLPLGKSRLGDNPDYDLANAYRRLSDANLAISRGSLAQLPRKPSAEAGEGRLVKDYLGPDGEHLSSDEDDDPFTSDDDEDRGRNKSPRPLRPDSPGDSPISEKASAGNGKGRQTLSLLAAAEEERTHVAAQQPQHQYTSMLEPEIRVTNASGDTVKPSKTVVHPNTSYVQRPGSATPSVVDSDEEAERDDIKRAQGLRFAKTQIISPSGSHRAIRLLYRGDYSGIVQAAEAENQRLRKYLVATDLSDESAHALEWAIGTVLRDGDTLIAIYCVDEDTGITSGDAGQVPDDAKSMKEQAAALASVSAVSDFRRATALALRGDSSAPNTPSGSPAPSGRGERNKADEERRRAVDDITARVIRLLRKTRLQVRVVVEVLHCKNPKHLITEVIDLVNPTLVVIGSRGRSALKGVILGSFSNYLVTKSSVPVMVARKRLRKQSKYKRTPVRQVNNLSNPSAKSLAMAKID